MAVSETYCVPVIDPETGEGWDEEVEALSPQEAAGKVDSGLFIASSFANKHLGADL